MQLKRLTRIGKWHWPAVFLLGVGLSASLGALPPGASDSTPARPPVESTPDPDLPDPGVHRSPPSSDHPDEVRPTAPGCGNGRTTDDVREVMTLLAEEGLGGQALELLIDRLAACIETDAGSIPRLRERLLSGDDCSDVQVFAGVLALGRAASAKGHRLLLEVVPSDSVPTDVTTLAALALGQRRGGTSFNRWEVSTAHCTTGYRIDESDVRRELVRIYRGAPNSDGPHDLRFALVTALRGSVDDPEVAAALRRGLSTAGDGEAEQILDALHGAPPDRIPGFEAELLALLETSEVGDIVGHAGSLLLRLDPERYWPPTSGALRRLLRRERPGESSAPSRDEYSSSGELGHALAWVSRDMPPEEALRGKLIASLGGDLKATNDQVVLLVALAAHIREDDGEDAWEQLLGGLASPSLKWVELRNVVSVLVTREFDPASARRILSAVERGLEGAGAEWISRICDLIRGWPSADRETEASFLVSLRQEPIAATLADRE